MAKHLVDIDEEALAQAKSKLSTKTIRDTVNQSLKRAGGTKESQVAEALKVLGKVKLLDRENAWR